MAQKKSSERLVRDIKRKTRRKFSSEEKIRIVIDDYNREALIALKFKSTQNIEVALNGSSFQPQPHHTTEVPSLFVLQ
jgi:hypothetical protein